MLDIMIDLETMSSKSNAAIVAIGAVVFDPKAGELLDMANVSTEGVPTCFYTNVELASCMHQNLAIDASTIYWWLSQSIDARETLLTNRISLYDALDRLRIFYNFQCKNGKAWAHATFDLPILHNAYSVYNEKPPWHYTDCRDVRTIYDLAYPHKLVPMIPDINKHHALYDAARQAIGVQQCYKALRAAMVV